MLQINKNFIGRISNFDWCHLCYYKENDKYNKNQVVRFLSENSAELLTIDKFHKSEENKNDPVCCR